MLRAEEVTANQIRELEGAGLSLYSGTANRTHEWARYVKLGFDGILTDDPVAFEFQGNVRP